MYIYMYILVCIYMYIHGYTSVSTDADADDWLWKHSVLQKNPISIAAKRQIGTTRRCLHKTPPIDTDA